MLMFRSLCLVSLGYLLSSSSYRLRKETQDKLVSERISDDEHELFLPWTKTVCTKTVSREEELDVYGMGHECPTWNSVRCGCHLGCDCPTFQTCYKNGWLYDLDGNTQRLGHCNFALWLVAVLLLILVMILSCCFYSCLLFSGR
eukprot:TRINITY_DN75609_c0_g1_i1.p1 TRINITY_DN75609_c0_g1~~TRINITY_DN75609_c0_g1_i1.p1  ORF type:complete len:151 (+),score=5.59 TRINITY_DN75609_c0_g1_i1:22-453(+)